MNRTTAPLLAATTLVALVAPSGIAAALVQEPQAKVVAPADAPAVAVVPPATPGAPPALAVIPPDPDAPPVAVIPPPGGEVRIVIPVASASVAGLPDCSSAVTTHCVLNGSDSSR